MGKKKVKKSITMDEFIQDIGERAEISNATLTEILWAMRAKDREQEKKRLEAEGYSAEAIKFIMAAAAKADGYNIEPTPKANVIEDYADKKRKKYITDIQKAVDEQNEAAKHEAITAARALNVEKIAALPGAEAKPRPDPRRSRAQDFRTRYYTPATRQGAIAGSDKPPMAPSAKLPGTEKDV